MHFVELRILDGAESIGGTKVFLDTGNMRLLLDFGLNYKRYGLYFEEYLKPRSSRGIADLWRLGLIPHHPDLYRDDLWPDDLPREGSPLEVDLILISHAHMDHCSLLGVVRPDIPVAASPTTWAILKAIQDAGKAEFHAETVYTVPRERVPGDPRVLKAPVRKSTAARVREIRLVGEAPAELVEFLQRPPNPRGRGLESGNIHSLADDSTGWGIRTFGVDHSIPGAVGYAVETDAGWVAYTGDLRLHGKGREQTIRFVEEVKRLRPRILLIEGTRAGPGGGGNPTEEEVAVRAQGIVAKNPGKLVIADFSPRQVERLQSFLDIAEATGRILVVLAKDMYLLEALEMCGWLEGAVGSPYLAIYDDVRVNPRAWERDIRERYRARMVGPREVREGPGRFILAFSFWDLKNLLDIEPQGGVYIYSSSEAHGEEQEIDMRRLWEWLRYFGLEVHGFAIDATGNPVFSGGLHASGHACPEDLLFIAREISPEILIPIHTEHPEFFAEHLKDESIEVRQVKNGDVIKI